MKTKIRSVPARTIMIELNWLAIYEIGLIKFPVSVKKEVIIPNAIVPVTASPRLVTGTIAIYAPQIATITYGTKPRTFIIGIMELVCPLAFMAFSTHILFRFPRSALVVSLWQNTLITFYPMSFSCQHRKVHFLSFYLCTHILFYKFEIAI